MRRLSIRWRLTLWNTLAGTSLLVVCGLIVYGMLRQAMYRQVDRLLQSQFEQLREDRRMGADPRSRIPHWIDEFQEHVGVLALVYDARGHVFARTEGLAAESLPREPLLPGTRASAPGTGRLRFATHRVPRIGLQRTLAAELSAGGEQFTVLLMAPLADVESNLARVRTVLLTALPASLLLAAAAGYGLSRKALAPVEHLRARMDEITASRLDERLPVDGPDDELGRLARTFNQMVARLERSFAEIRRFTADASHELRTPLTVLRTEVEVAMGKALGENAVRDLLASVLEECQRLTKLTDQLLALSRDDAGMTPYPREPIDLQDLLQRVVETMRPLAAAKQQTLTFSPPARSSVGSEKPGREPATPARVIGDAVRLRQLFYNLLDNASKYTPEQGRIEVTIDSTAGPTPGTGEDARPSGPSETQVPSPPVPGGPAVVTVAVRDTGMGIPAEHLPHVFDRFYRVDKARSREQGGAGLGLSIAKAIVTAHGGRIAIRSEPGKGTTCVVQLPLAPV